MPREDLSKELVKRILGALENEMKIFFEGSRQTGGSLESGHVRYEIVPKEGDALSTSSLYKKFASFYESESIGCEVTLDEFPGDPDKNIPASTEGMFIVCDNNKVFFHIELCGNNLELNAWSRGLA